MPFRVRLGISDRNSLDGRRTKNEMAASQPSNGLIQRLLRILTSNIRMESSIGVIYVTVGNGYSEDFGRCFLCLIDDGNTKGCNIYMYIYIYQRPINHQGGRSAAVMIKRHVRGGLMCLPTSLILCILTRESRFFRQHSSFDWIFPNLFHRLYTYKSLSPHPYKYKNQNDMI